MSLELSGISLVSPAKCGVHGMKRIYTPRVVADHMMLQEDFERLYKFLLETDDLSEVSDDIRELVEQEWPELVHKLPPKAA
jgi:hypothetical protein